MTPSPLSRRQRGAAALIVVMLLFFIVALVGAYAHRNLLFELRTAGNQVRSTQAFSLALLLRTSVFSPSGSSPSRSATSARLRRSR